MISLDQAWTIILEAAVPLGSERVGLEAAHTRVLAEPVVALVDWPPADVSAMDGYAVREADPSPLRLIGQSFPGAGFAGTIGVGECVLIFTGAPIPLGADRIVMQEDAVRDGEDVTFAGPHSGGSHIRRRGSDFRAGDTLLSACRRLGSLALVAAAGADVADVAVWRRPRVTILGTGDELVAPGSARERPGSIPESISLGIGAMVSEWGGETVGRICLPDELPTIARAAATAIHESDVVVVTGGASVGDKDCSKAALAQLGFEPSFDKVAIKPGKPVWFGRVGETLVLGLPGNPTSALVTARLLLAPLIAGLAGRDAADALRWRSAALGAPLGACGERETLVRARCDRQSVVPLANQDSGAQKALADSNCLVRRSAGSPALVAGDLVDIIDFDQRRATLAALTDRPLVTPTRIELVFSP